MTEPISEERNPLWDIYNDGFPDFLAELLEAEELQRLKKVGMHCGCEYSSFPLFRFSSPYTRWIHSVGGIPVRISKICTQAAEAVREYLHTDFDRWISVSGEQECKQ